MSNEIKKLSLSEFAPLQEKWATHNFPNATSVEPLLGMGEELGELYHAHLKGIQGIRHTPEEIRLKKEDAIGDILIYLTHYCRLEGIDPEVALAKAWTPVEKRDWKRNPLTAAQ